MPSGHKLETKSLSLSLEPTDNLKDLKYLFEVNSMQSKTLISLLTDTYSEIVSQAIELSKLPTYKSN